MGKHEPDPGAANREAALAAAVKIYERKLRELREQQQGK